EQEIVSADSTRLTYRQFAERVGRLASGLASLEVEPGDTVAIMDWDTPRYLECFFAVPMMGVVLHTVNVRLSAEHILYTINHAEDDIKCRSVDGRINMGERRKIMEVIKDSPRALLANARCLTEGVNL